MTNTQSLSVDKLTYSYQHKPILRNLSFALCQGQGLLVQGENGSGKSTLLKILSGLLLPDNGMLSWSGQAIADSENKLRFKKSMGFLGHKDGLKGSLSILENLKFSLQLHNIVLPENTNEVLTRLGLQSQQENLVSSLSFGQKRKTALARLILMQKSLWLLDEPFAGLDKSSTEYIKQILKNHIKTKGMVILTHHGKLELDMPLAQLNLVGY